MEKLRVPLVGVYNQRTIAGSQAIAAGEDQRFINVTFDAVRNPITGKTAFHVQKRPGFGVMSLVASGSPSTGFIRSDVIGSVVSAFGATTSTIYDGVTSVGSITGLALHFSETIINAIGHVMIKSSDGTGWYYPSNAKTTVTYTADGNNSTTITDIKIAGANDTTGLYPGQLLAAATNIVVGTRIVSVDSGAFTAVLDTATTGGAFADLSITKTPIAKITDADFVTSGTTITSFEFLDGFTFYGNSDNYIYNSDINSITAYTSTNKIAANIAPDTLLAIAKYKNLIIGFGNSTIEFFRNAGNATGSILSIYEELVKRVGIQDQRSLTTLADDIYFASSTRDGDCRILRLRGLNIEKVSTPAEDRILGTAVASGGKIYLSSFNLGGYSYVSVVVTSSATTTTYMLLEDDGYMLLEDGGKMILEGGEAVDTDFAAIFLYNVELNIWCEWDTTVMTFVRGLGSGSINQIAATSRLNTGGKIYLINPAADGELYTDDGTAYTMTIQTAKLDFGTDDRKFIPEIELIADQESSGTATLEKSDDDYATWQTLGTFDMTQKKKKIHGGSHIGGRAYRITHSANAAFRAQALDFAYEIGSV